VSTVQTGAALCTRVTRWTIKLSVSPDETQTACGSMVHVRFHPAGGEMSFWVNNRVTRVIYTTYAITDPEE